MPFGVLCTSRTLDCPCAAACRPLDMQGDVLLRCTRASPGPSVRHDMWRAVWSAFLSAHSIVHVDDPQREMRRCGLATPDVVVWLPSRVGRMGIDVTIRHTVSSAFPFRFGRYSTVVTRAERDKRTAYAAGRGWVRLPGAVLPVVATTMGTMGPTAWYFFDSVVHERRQGSVADSDVYIGTPANASRAGDGAVGTADLCLPQDCGGHCGAGSAEGCHA